MLLQLESPQSHMQIVIALLVGVIPQQRIVLLGEEAIRLEHGTRAVPSSDRRRHRIVQRLSRGRVGRVETVWKGRHRRGVGLLFLRVEERGGGTTSVAVKERSLRTAAVVARRTREGAESSSDRSLLDRCS